MTNPKTETVAKYVKIYLFLLNLCSLLLNKCAIIHKTLKQTNKSRLEDWKSCFKDKLKQLGQFEAEQKESFQNWVRETLTNYVYPAEEW
jgi:hypothetical protein